MDLIAISKSNQQVYDFMELLKMKTFDRDAFTHSIQNGQLRIDPGFADFKQKNQIYANCITDHAEASLSFQ